MGTGFVEDNVRDFDAFGAVVWFDCMSSVGFEYGVKCSGTYAGYSLDCLKRHDDVGDLFVPVLRSAKKAWLSELEKCLSARMSEGDSRVNGIVLWNLWSYEASEESVVTYDGDTVY